MCGKNPEPGARTGADAGIAAGSRACAATADWVAMAGELAALVPLARLDPEAARELRRAGAGQGGVAVACSGGADSVATALLTWSLFPALRGRLTLLHFNHRTRVECEVEARFVHGLARGLGAGFVAGVREPHGEGAFRFVSEDRVRKGEGCPGAGEPGNPCPDAGEVALREARLRFFRAACGRCGARWLVQGHHADDVLENVLMRLGRGAGTAGLAAPRPVQRFMAGAPEDRGGAVEADAGGRGAGAAPGVVFVRPLLALRKAEILAALSAAGACWHEDNTNAQDAHLRNRIRHHVAPVWERVQERDSVAGVLRSRRLLDEDAAALEAWAGDAWVDIAGGREVAILPRAISALDWRPAAGLPVAIQRRLVRKALCLLAPGAMPGAGVVDSVAGALVAGRAGRWNVVAGGALVFDGVTLRVDRQRPGGSSFGLLRIFAPLVAAGGLFWTTPAAGTAGGGEMASLREDPDGAGGDARLVAGWLSLERVVLSGTEFSRLCAGHFSPERLACLALAPEGEGGGGAPEMGFPPVVPFRVRQWRAGDSYRPLGAPGRRKLSDMFGERGIPAAVRHVLPVVCDAVTGGILWVPGLPPAHAWRLRTCSPCFRLTWKPAFSTSPRSVTLAETQTRQI